MTRIVAGDAGSTRLEVPPRGTRPTSDRVREGLFSALAARMNLAEAAVLDLYAGSGALGLEAVSRGAQRAVLVDRATDAVTACRRNARSVTKALGGRSTASITVTKASAQSFLRTNTTTFDLVFVDPPYGLESAELTEALASLSRHLTAEALVIVERDRRSAPPFWPDGYEPIKTSHYGDTTLLWARWHQAPARHTPA